MKKKKYKFLINLSIIVTFLLFISIYTYNSLNLTISNSATTSPTPIATNSYTRKELQNMVVATAKSFYYNGKYSDYEQHGMDNKVKVPSSADSAFSSFAWRNLNITPEAVSRSNRYATDCSGLIFAIYNSTLGYDFYNLIQNYMVEQNNYIKTDGSLSHGKTSHNNYIESLNYGIGPSTFNFVNASRVKNSGVKTDSSVVYYYNFSSTYYYTDTTKTYTKEKKTIETVENNIHNTLQPGDIYVYRRKNNSTGVYSGHVVIYIGNNEFVQSIGDDYPISTSGVVSDYKKMVESGPNHDTSVVLSTWDADSSKNSRGIKNLSLHDSTTTPTEVVILRPINNYCNGNNCTINTLNENAKARAQLSDVAIEQWMSELTPISKIITQYNSVNVGDKVVFYLEFNNKSSSSKTISEISVERPNNTEFSSAASGYSGKDKIVWKNITIPANSKKQIFYAVKISKNSNITHPGYKITVNGTTLKMASLTVTVNNTINSTSDIKQLQNIEPSITADDELEAIKKIYKNGLKMDIDEIGTYSDIQKDVFTKYQNNYFTKSTSNAKTNKMVVPGLYGGRLLKGDTTKDRVKLFTLSSLEAGDIIITWKGDTTAAFMYNGQNSEQRFQIARYLADEKTGQERIMYYNDKQDEKDKSKIIENANQIFREIFSKDLFVVLRPSRVVSLPSKTTTTKPSTGNNTTPSTGNNTKPSTNNNNSNNNSNNNNNSSNNNTTNNNNNSSNQENNNSENETPEIVSEKIEVQAKKGSKLPNLETPKRTGYSFEGYYSETNGNGTKYYNSTGTSDIIWNQNSTTVSMYSNWTPNKYTITYDSNGGKGNTTNSNHVYDSKQKLSKNTYSKEGYTFLGWSTDKNATTAEFLDEEVIVNLTSNPNDNVTLYAVWIDDNDLLPNKNYINAEEKKETVKDAGRTSKIIIISILIIITLSILGYSLTKLLKR